jgi:hypothetical protein
MKAECLIAFRFYKEIKFIMPYQQFKDGFYLIKRRSEKYQVIDHYGVLDIGNTMRHRQLNGTKPVVIHQVLPNIRIDWLETTGSWEVEGLVNPIFNNEVRERIKEAFTNPQYDLFANNCEQVARYIIEGTKYSTQLRNVGLVVGGVALFALLSADWE